MSETEHRARATSTATSTRATLVYDGACGFCSRCARWVETHARGVDVVPWQSMDLPTAGLTEHQVRTAAYWLQDGRAEGAERAVARTLLRCGHRYAVLGRVLLLPGVRSAAALGYRWVAGHRGSLGFLLPKP